MWGGGVILPNLPPALSSTSKQNPKSPTWIRVKEMEEEKTVKHMDFADEVRRQFRVKTVIVPIILGALGTALSESLKKLGIEDVIGSLETAVLISITAILMNLNLYGSC